MEYEKFKDSQFWAFFHVDESRTDNDVIWLKTGGFQEYVDIKITLDGSTITKAQLLLDRAWVGNASRINPFAKDIAKSFVFALLPNTLGKALAAQLWNLKGDNDEVVTFGGEEPVSAPDEEMSALLDAYVGARKLASAGTDGTHLMISNMQEGIVSIAIAFS
jgi:hypothetical protein